MTSYNVLLLLLHMRQNHRMHASSTERKCAFHMNNMNVKKTERLLQTVKWWRRTGMMYDIDHDIKTMWQIYFYQFRCTVNNYACNKINLSFIAYYCSFNKVISNIIGLKKHLFKTSRKSKAFASEFLENLYTVRCVSKRFNCIADISHINNMHHGFTAPCLHLSHRLTEVTHIIIGSPIQ